VPGGENSCHSGSELKVPFSCMIDPLSSLGSKMAWSGRLALTPLLALLAGRQAHGTTADNWVWHTPYTELRAGGEGVTDGFGVVRLHRSSACMH
jgi:hypothetical protein